MRKLMFFQNITKCKVESIPNHAKKEATVLLQRLQQKHPPNHPQKHQQPKVCGQFYGLSNISFRLYYGHHSKPSIAKFQSLMMIPGTMMTKRKKVDSQYFEVSRRNLAFLFQSRSWDFFQEMIPLGY